jgi:hypothetical protein
MIRLSGSPNKRGIYHVGSSCETLILDMDREFCSGGLWSAEGESGCPYIASGSEIAAFHK